MSKITALVPKEGVKLIRDAITVREQISDIYNEYRGLSKVAGSVTQVATSDIKRAVDAIYYLGGGWPSENSKGRMEALLDNFVGMYRILDFIGEGDMVKKHLAKYGVTVSLAEEFKIENIKFSQTDIKYMMSQYNGTLPNIETISDSRTLMTNVVLMCVELQGRICHLADVIKDDLHHRAQGLIGVEDEEFVRFCDLVKTASIDKPQAQEKFVNKKVKIHKSMSAFNNGLKVI